MRAMVSTHTVYIDLTATQPWVVRVVISTITCICYVASIIHELEGCVWENEVFRFSMKCVVKYCSLQL